MTAEWVVVLEAASLAFGSSASIGVIRRIMESMADMHPTTLYSPQRYALQVMVGAPTPEEALAVALADWRRAESSLGIEPWLLTRAEVISPEEFERERSTGMAALAAGTEGEGAGSAQALEERLLRQAFHDSLTGLANTELFLDHLQHALRAANRKRVRLALILCDIDEFQGVNERFGRGAADELLVTVADRLSSALRPRDSIARIGSDEFAILIEDTSALAAAMIGQRLLSLIAAPLVLQGQEKSITASMGIAVSGPGQGSDELLEHSRSALAAAQRRGPGQWEIFARNTSRAGAPEMARPRPQRPDDVACLRLLQRATMAANECETLEDAARIVLRQVCTHTGWPLGHLYVVPENSGGLISSGVWHVSSSPERFAPFRAMTQELVIKHGVGLPHEVLETGRPACMPDVASDAEFTRAGAAVAAGIRAGFAFPILTGDEVVGVLEFYADVPVEPEDALWDVMGSVGTQLGRVVERHRSAVALRRSEERFRRCVRSIPGAVVSVRPDGTVVDWLGAAERMFGCSEGDVLGRPFATVLPGLFPADALAEEVLGGLVDQTVETSAVRWDGVSFPVEVSVSTWRASEGGQFFTVMICDVTERKEAESELRHREALFQALLKHSSDMVSVLDTDGTLRLHFGPRVLGYEEGEKVGTRVWELLHPDDLERAMFALGELLSKPWLGPRPIELRVRHRDGSWHWIEVVATNLTDNSDVGGVVLNSRDITERKLLEQALDNAHEELEAAQAAAGFGRWRVVGEQNNRAWSPEMYQIFGCDPAQPPPDDEALVSLLHPEDRDAFSAEVERVLAGEPRSFDFRIFDRNGGLRWISSRALPLRDIDGSIMGMHGVAADVTSRKEGSSESVRGVPAHATRSRA